MTSTTTAEITAFPSPSESELDGASPGAVFAQAVRKADGDVTVPIPGYLPSAFPLFSARPRYTVRHLLRTLTVSAGPVAFIAEEPATTSAGYRAGTSYEATPEAAVQPTLRTARLTTLRVDVPLPAGLLAHPDQLRMYVDYRVLVRMGVRENQVLLHGSPDQAIIGLLRLPGLRRGPSVRVDGLPEAAAAVEETGGSCDGIVVHPRLYWDLVMSGLLGRLAAAGIRVSRTRMMPTGHALLGDFRAALTFLDPRISSLTLRRGVGRDAGDVIEARSRMGLAVHLPQHLLLVDVTQSQR